ncbi:hypothetical protein U1Q18_009071 [Sarracenia purpurea var. burkii]
MEKSASFGSSCEELRKMALGKRCRPNVRPARDGEDLGLGLGLGFVRYTRSMSGKRIAISSNMDVDSTAIAPIIAESPEKSLLETLPQDILIRVLCGVDHDDLKQLFLVSKQIKEAALIAKQLHFEYSTPRKFLAFRNPFDLGNGGASEDLAKTPNAPKQVRCRSRLNEKKLADLSVNLFPSSPDDENFDQGKI